MSSLRLTAVAFVATLAAGTLAVACAPKHPGTPGDSAAARDSVVAAPAASQAVPNAASDSVAPPSTPAASAVPMPNASPGRVSPSASPAAATSHAAVDSLERVARALAHTDGCRGASDCRVAPVGTRPCGGPRTFLPYCRLTTDSAALFRALAALERAERAYNERSGMASTCEMRLAPAPTFEGGRCGPSGGGGRGGAATPGGPAKTAVP